MTRLSTRRISRAENMRIPPNPPKALIGCRHIQILLLTLGFFCCYAVRVALSISLVAMVKPNTSDPDIQVFDWSESVQNTILSSFFWGYVITHIPGGELAQRFGAQRFLCFAVGICGVVTILIPTAATYGGWQAVIVLRVLTGACQGVIPPAMHTILSKWVLSAGIYIAGNFAFVFFGKATVQSWNDGTQHTLGNSTARESYKIQEEPMPYESQLFFT